MGVQVIQSAISLLAAIPAAFIHALNFLIASSRPLVLLSTRDGYERIHLAGKNVSQELIKLGAGSLASDAQYASRRVC